ncbi:MAG: DinB family protein [Saprospiraceae bacterium]
MKRPKKGEFASFYQGYLDTLPSRGTVQSLLKKTFKEAQQLLGNLPEEKGNYAYEPGKWTIKQMLIHIIDAERVFAFRALWGIRGDRAPLPGFNQDFWMEEAKVEERSIKDLLKEWKTVRDNTLALAAQCSEDQSKFLLTASNWKVSVRALFFIIIGHQVYHLKVLRERYL